MRRIFLAVVIIVLVLNLIIFFENFGTGAIGDLAFFTGKASVELLYIFAIFTGGIIGVSWTLFKNMSSSDKIDDSLSL